MQWLFIESERIWVIMENNGSEMTGQSNVSGDAPCDAARRDAVRYEKTRVGSKRQFNFIFTL